MTNKTKSLLRQLCKQGFSFEEIKGEVDCSDSTIKKYLKIFKSDHPNEQGEK